MDVFEKIRALLAEQLDIDPSNDHDGQRYHETILRPTAWISWTW